MDVTWVDINYQYYCCISDVVRLQEKAVRVIVTMCMKLLPHARSIMVSWDHWMGWNMQSNMNNNKMLYSIQLLKPN